MNKINTKKIISDFSARIDSKRASFDRLVALVLGTPAELSDLNFLCENYLGSVYVEFECLVSDLFHGYINNSNRTYLAGLELKIKRSVKDKYSPWHALHTSFSGPKHIASAQLSQLVDPTNWNVTFKDVAAMQLRAKEWLSPAHERGFSAMSPSDVALVDAMHGIRNCIAHNSESSRKVMNSKVRAVDTGLTATNAGLGIGANNIKSIGKYLRATVPGGMRIGIYSDKLKNIGTSLL